MTSDTPTETFVWLWLPGANEPVIAGRLFKRGGNLLFNYGRSYLARKEAIPIYLPELPLEPGALPLEPGLIMPGCIRDAAPDAWGRRVILNRMLGHKGTAADPDQLGELTYFLASGSDRIGALDFQESATIYAPRTAGATTLEELRDAAEKVERGIPLSPDLDQALLHGSSLGGARPKALMEGNGKKYIAKFSSQTDVFDVVKGEYVAMRLAALTGQDVARVRLERAAGKDVLLVERFDRLRQQGGWHRKAMVSALTLFGLDEMMARYASYADLAEIIRHRFTEPKKTLKELFGRIVFNILCGNVDDHARNHAAFWDGRSLILTPAYDICPQARTGTQATQSMLITGDSRESRLALCITTAENFHLSQDEATGLIERQITTIRDNWLKVAEEAALSETARNAMWRRQFLNPYAFEGAPQSIRALEPV